MEVQIMTVLNSDLDRALNEVSASSAGGAPFLIAYGATFFITGILSFFISLEAAALIAMFQGSVALPIAFWLERRLGTGRMAADNPLRPLSVQLAMSQILGLPALIVIYSLNPVAVPAVLAGLGGVHFIPYAWLHRTRLYIILGVALAIGAFVLLILLRSQALPYTLLYIGILYWILAPLVYRHAQGIVRAAA
jgi:hypothetical protein